MRIYADTSALIAWFNPADEFAPAVTSWCRERAPEFSWNPLLRNELRHNLRRLSGKYAAVPGPRSAAAPAPARADCPPRTGPARSTSPAHRCGRSLDPLMLVVPIPRPDHVVGRAQCGELPVQNVAKWTGFVARDNPPALRDLFLHPRQKILRMEPLGRLGKLAIILHGHNVLEQMYVQRQLERARLRWVIYRLH